LLHFGCFPDEEVEALAMSVLPENVHSARRALHERRKSDLVERRALRILAVVDNPENTARVIQYLLDLHGRQARFEVVLLNIRPEPEDWRLRGYGWFKREEIRERLINDLARPAVMNAGQHLNRVGIAHKDRIELGRAADTILRCAHEEKCGLVVMAETNPGVIRRWLLRSARISVGSVASVVIGLAQVPVIVVK
jgi:nucleotide-binding universal stress UspA family protein